MLLFKTGSRTFKNLESCSAGVLVSGVRIAACTWGCEERWLRRGMEVGCRERAERGQDVGMGGGWLVVGGG